MISLRNRTAIVLSLGCCLLASARPRLLTARAVQSGEAAKTSVTRHSVSRLTTLVGTRGPAAERLRRAPPGSTRQNPDGSTAAVDRRLPVDRSHSTVDRGVTRPPLDVDLVARSRPDGDSS